jgi:Ca2+/H+ antiporter
MPIRATPGSLLPFLNGMVGMTLAIGAIRHVQQEYNLQGATTFLAVISALAIIALWWCRPSPSRPRRRPSRWHRRWCLGC